MTGISLQHHCDCHQIIPAGHFNLQVTPCPHVGPHQDSRHKHCSQGRAKCYSPPGEVPVPPSLQRYWYISHQTSQSRCVSHQATYVSMDTASRWRALGEENGTSPFLVLGAPLGERSFACTKDVSVLQRNTFSIFA